MIVKLTIDEKTPEKTYTSERWKRVLIWNPKEIIEEGGSWDWKKVIYVK